MGNMQLVYLGKRGKLGVKEKEKSMLIPKPGSTTKCWSSTLQKLVKSVL